MPEISRPRKNSLRNSDAAKIPFKETRDSFHPFEVVDFDAPKTAGQERIDELERTKREYGTYREIHKSGQMLGCH
jgi:hypothetical protein